MSWEAAPHMTAWLALLNADLATMSPPRTAYEYDDAPLTGGNYLICFLSRTSGDNLYTAGGDVTSTWRLSIRSIGVGVNNTRVLMDRANAVVEHARIVVAEDLEAIPIRYITSTPTHFQTEDPIRQDEHYADLWSGLRSYTYAL